MSNTVAVDPSVVAGMSYEQLRAAQDTIASQLSQISDQARADALTAVAASVKEFGFSHEEIDRAVAGKGKPGRKPGAKASTGNANTGTKAPIKYRNPADHSQTWTGRGKAPLWIRDVPVEGREAFLIVNAVPPKGDGIENEPTEPTPVDADASPAPEALEATQPIFGGANE